MTKKGKKSKITSRENWRKDLKLTEILMEGEVRGPATGDFSPFQLHHRISDPRGNRNEPCNRARRANEKRGQN